MLTTALSATLTPFGADLAESVNRFFDAAGTFFSSLAAINWIAAAIAFAFTLVMLLARGRAWQNTLKAAYPQEPVLFRTIAAAYIVGAGLNSFIPARVGDAVKIFLARQTIRDSSYPAITSSFFVQSVFDTGIGVLVLAYAVIQGLLPSPPSLPNIPAFDISFWANNPRFLIFFLTAVAIAVIILIAVLSERAERFWEHVKQGGVVLADRDRYLRGVASWQAVGWLARFLSFWFFLEAFHIPASVESVLLVMSVQTLSTILPFTPGGAGAQQALLVATLSAAGTSKTNILAYSVGQQIAVAAWTALLGFLALTYVFGITDWRALIRSAEAEGARDGAAEAGTGRG